MTTAWVELTDAAYEKVEGFRRHAPEPDRQAMWLEVTGTEARYAPHTEAGFRAPANKTIVLLANGFLARRGLAKARKEGRAAALG